MKTLTEKELDHLKWIYERMVHVHGENPNYDYMHAFRKAISPFKIEIQMR